jgi:DNA-binding transcriptional MerR regulator
MFSIGEFARLGAVSVRTLRHYDEIGLLSPATVDSENGYRGYSADQLGQLHRIVALKELGLSLTQAKRLIGGITLEELQGMLALQRAQLEQELVERKNQLRGVEARLRYLAREGAMPADDIAVKTVPPMGVVRIGAAAPGFGPANVVPVVNQCKLRFDELGLPGLVREAGPYMICYDDSGEALIVYVALPVAERPAELPAPAEYVVLPEVEVAFTVRNGSSRDIFPMVYHDLVQWLRAQGCEPHGPGRDIWIHEIHDVADVSQQVFESQMPFSRPPA